MLTAFCAQTAQGLMLLQLYPDDPFHPIPIVPELEESADGLSAVVGTEMQNRLGKRAILHREASGARLHRLLSALLSPNLQRRRPRGLQLLDRPTTRGGWRPAFQRTGGTILLGKRATIGAEEKPAGLGEEEWPGDQLVLKAVPGLVR